MSSETYPLMEADSRVPEREDVPESLRRLVCISLSHETVPTERIGAVSPDDPQSLATAIKRSERITECVVLTTCNRVEVYASTRTASEQDLSTALRSVYESLGKQDGIEEFVGIDAVEHLARVSCGLESAILGEDQILGQVSRAFEAARESDLAGGALSRSANTAIRAGRTAREQTDIGAGQSGYGGVICRSIESELGHQPEHVLVVGAGEMARQAVRAVKRRWESRVDIANRSEELELTSDDGTYWPLTELDKSLQSADAVVTATGAPDPVIRPEHIDHCGPETPVVDLANPSDVSADDRVRERLSVTELDELTTHLRNTTQTRRKEIPAVEEIIDDAVTRLIETERENRAEETLRELHCQAAEIRDQELQKALSRLEASDGDCEEILSDFASALTGQLLAEPTDSLRAAARDGDTETIAAANRLFDLDGGESP